MQADKSRQFAIPKAEKKQVAQRLRQALQAKPEVLFAFLYGSFWEGAFRDIDIAVFLGEKSISPERQLDYQLDLIEELAPLVDYPLDVRVLNGAPLAFRYNVYRGQLLFTRDERLSSQFVERTWDEYFDFLPIIDKYLEEFAHG